MARIVILWNEHPTETLAGFHAKKVMKHLEELGHEVIPEKIPYEETVQGIVSKIPLGEGELTQKAAEEAAKKIMDLKFSEEIAKLALNKHKADFCFNFHTSHWLLEGQPEKLKAYEVLPSLYGGGIEFSGDLSRRAFTVELPAYLLPLPPRLLETRLKQVGLARAELKKLIGFESDSLRSRLAFDRHLSHSVISLPQDDTNQRLDYLVDTPMVSLQGGKTRGERLKWLRDLIEKYKHPSISRKIADFIHGKTLEKEGKK